MTRIFQTRRFAAVLLLAGTCFAAHAASVDDLREAARLQEGSSTTRAVVIWKSWAERNADAAYNLAEFHQYGEGVAVDQAAALQWYRVAAEQHDKVSQFQIGLMYQTGQGIAAKRPAALATADTGPTVR